MGRRFRTCPSLAQPAAEVEPLWRRLLAELLGSGLLAAIVIGSGIAAQTLSPRDTGLQLLQNAVVTAAGLYVLIVVFGQVSGAHLNPIVTAADLVLHRTRARVAAAYMLAQVAGCCLGALLANAMFARPVVELSRRHRMTGAHWLAEVVATAGLLVVIFGLSKTETRHLSPAATACYVGAAYFFTSSTSFANPAITAGRMLSNTFAGIAPSSAPGFISAQIVGGGVGLGLLVLLFPHLTGRARA